MNLKFSIITPSFGQFDWLKLCIASVSDQASVSDHVGTRYERGNVKRGKVGECESNDLHAFEPSNLPTAQSPLSIEHIIQDGETPGIEEFARDMKVYLSEKNGGGSNQKSPNNYAVEQMIPECH